MGRGRWWRSDWRPSMLGFEGTFLVALAVGGLLPMPFTSPLDRYFIQVMAPLAPVLALVAARGEAARGKTTPAAWPRVAVLAVMAASVAFYAVAQQDYEAWQTARDAAARQSYRQLLPRQVEAGYEAVATYTAVPDFLATGLLTIDPIDLKPTAPVARLAFASPGDPRPGVSYSSLSPGRIVIVCVDPASSTCPFRPH